MRCPFLSSDKLFQSKVMCQNLVWIGWNRRYGNFEGGKKPPIRGGYMWPVMPIFELGRAIPVESHMWKFGSDWLSLSRVIVSTNKHTNKHPKKKKSQTQLKTISFGKFFSGRIISKRRSKKFLLQARQGQIWCRLRRWTEHTCKGIWKFSLEEFPLFWL